MPTAKVTLVLEIEEEETKEDIEDWMRKCVDMFTILSVEAEINDEN